MLVEVTFAWPRNGDPDTNLAGVEHTVTADGGVERPSWELLAAVVSKFYRHKLLHCARRCLTWQPRETAVQAEDLVQAVLALLLAGRIRWYGLTHLLPSLYLTIHNLSRDARKAAWSRKAQPLEDATFVSDVCDATAYHAAYRALLARDQDAALEKLPPKMRGAVTGCLVNRSTAKEVARDHGTTEPTVRTQLAKARLQLQAELVHYAQDLVNH